MLTDFELLNEYKKAYQQLMLGRSVRVVQKDGRRIEYNPSNIDKLRNEIIRLESLLGMGRRLPPAGII